MSEIKNESCVGQIQIADEVIAVIAGTAASEIEGVAFMSGNITGEIVGAFGKKNLSKGVKIFVDGSDVVIDINLLIKPNYKVPKVAAEVQERVKTAVETMTGLTAKEVNINILGIAPEKMKNSAEVIAKEQK